jgi:hypothetical protein
MPRLFSVVLLFYFSQQAYHIRVQTKTLKQKETPQELASIPLNAATRELKQLLADTNNASFQTFLQDLSPAASTDYSLWKAAKKAKQATNSSHPLRTTGSMGPNEH